MKIYYILWQSDLKL